MKPENVCLYKYIYNENKTLQREPENMTYPSMYTEHGNIQQVQINSYVKASLLYVLTVRLEDEDDVARVYSLL